MILKDFLPIPTLREFIRCYRIVHFDFSKFSEIPKKVYPPKPENCLHFFILGNMEIETNDNKKEIFKNPVFVGQQTLPFKRYNTKKIINFQIVFQSSALYLLTGIPSNEIVNKHIDAESLFSKKFTLINEKLQEAKTNSEILFIANKFMAELIPISFNKPQPLDRLINDLMKNEDTPSIDWMAKQSYYSNKQFKRKFNERTGVNPKTYIRLVRFNKAFNIKNRYPEMDWLRIAVECNYYDYQHLVIDYKDFTGLTPTEFHLIESKSPECLLGLADEIYKSRTKPVFNVKK